MVNGKQLLGRADHADHATWRWDARAVLPDGAACRGVLGYGNVLLTTKGSSPRPARGSRAAADPGSEGLSTSCRPSLVAVAERCRPRAARVRPRPSPVPRCAGVAEVAERDAVDFPRAIFGLLIEESTVSSPRGGRLGPRVPDAGRQGDAGHARSRRGTPPWSLPVTPMIVAEAPILPTLGIPRRVPAVSRWRAPGAAALPWIYG